VAAVSSTGPGAIRVAPGELELNADRGPDERGELTFTNTADRPIQIGSHIHLAEVNAGLEFDRAAATGFRLDIAAGTSVRFEPGASRTVGIVALRGARSVPGISITPADAARPAPGEAR
jgi:urease beta subunit